MDTKTKGRLRGKWLGLTLDATDEEAREAFTRRFGYAPARLVRGRVIMYAGPIVKGAPGAILSAGNG
jgi:hypothetical protein